MTPTNNELQQQITEVDGRVSVLEATSGKIALTPGVLMLVWVIAVAVVGAAGAAAVTAFQTHELAQQARDLTKELRDHEKQEFHDKGGQIVNGLREDVKRLRGFHER